MNNFKIKFNKKLVFNKKLIFNKNLNINFKNYVNSFYNPINQFLKNSKNKILVSEFLKFTKIDLKEFFEGKIKPAEMQKDVLMKILRENKNTIYGKKYNFKNIKTVEDFQKNVPIINYTKLIPYIKEIKDGKNNILTKKKVIFFATTSGTTKSIEPKLIPITTNRLNNFRKEFLLWALYIIRKNPKIIYKKTLYFAGPPDEFVTKSGIPCGSISGYHVKKLPFFLKHKVVIPWQIYNINNFDEKTEKIALLALQNKISQIAFASPIEAILFFEYIKKNKNKLINLLIKNKKLKTVKKIKNKKFTPKELWPDLCLISCIKSRANMFYIEKLKKLIGNEIEIRDPGIYASEGRISLAIAEDGISGIPVINYNFFEYIPLNKKKVLTVEQLELNQLYRVIMTTNEGLYRYDIGDIIKVVGFLKKVPLIVFYDRDNFLNIAGELAHENIIVEAIKESIQKFNFNVNGFTIIPCFKGNKPRYELLIEINHNNKKEVNNKINHNNKINSKQVNNKINHNNKINSKQVNNKINSKQVNNKINSKQVNNKINSKQVNNKINSKQVNDFRIEIDKNLQYFISDYKQMRNEFGRMDELILSIVKEGSFDKINKEHLSKSGQPKPIYINKDPEFKNKFEIIKTFS
jgi:hypothetical protein